MSNPLLRDDHDTEAEHRVGEHIAARTGRTLIHYPPSIRLPVNCHTPDDRWFLQIKTRGFAYDPIWLSEHQYLSMLAWQRQHPQSWVIIVWEFVGSDEPLYLRIHDVLDTWPRVVDERTKSRRNGLRGPNDKETMIHVPLSALRPVGWRPESPEYPKP